MDFSWGSGGGGEIDSFFEGVSLEEGDMGSSGFFDPFPTGGGGGGSGAGRSFGNPNDIAGDENKPDPTMPFTAAQLEILRTAERTVVMTLRDGKIGRVSPMIGVTAEREDNWLKDLWNSPFVRGYIPDFYKISFSGAGVGGIGASGSIDLLWVTRGPEASISPMITGTFGLGAGFDISIEAGIQKGWYLSSNTQDIYRDLLTNNPANGENPTIAGTLGLRCLGNVSVNIDDSPLDNQPDILFIGASIGVGVPTVVGGSLRTEFTGQIWDFYKK